MIKMTVREAIKGKDNYCITRDGEILGINSAKDELLDLEVKKVRKIEGIIKDLTCIRL